MIEQPKSALYRWEKLSGKLPEDAIYTSQYYVVARTKIDNKYRLARYDLGKSDCTCGWGEYKSVKDFEILVAEPGAIVEWVTAYLGDYPFGGISADEEGQFIGRASSGGVEKRLKPGYINSKDQLMYVVCETGRWVKFNYEALVIRDPSDLKATECGTPFSWCSWEGLDYPNAVCISERYVVGRSIIGSGSLAIYGELDLENHQFQLVWENVVQERWPAKVDVLVHNKDAIVEWVPYDCTKPAPDNSIGYDLTVGNRYVGRISNALTMGKYVPAMIDKEVEKCIYIRDYKILEAKKCEILVIKNAPKKRD